MKELQSVVLGLIVVFVDAGSPDWVADPLGWILVLVGIAAVKDRLTDYGYLQLTGWVCLALSVVTWPPDAVPALDDTLGWMFSLPTLAFCFLLADSLTDVTEQGLSRRFRAISWLYAIVTVLPLLPLLLGWERLSTPAQVVTVIAQVVLVISLVNASDEDAVLSEEQTAAADRSAPGRAPATATSSSTQDSAPQADEPPARPPEGRHKA